MSRVGRRLSGRGVCAGAILAILAVQLVMAGAATAGDRQDWFYPANIYTETRTTLVWDGKPVVLEGTVHCERNANFNAEGDLRFGMLDHRPPMHDCSPEWLATRLDDGSALLVGAYGVAGGWRRDGVDEPESFGEMREHLARVPRAVIWLDDPVNPTRGEYYFSSIALDDPRSRLTAISTELVSVSRHGMLTGPLFGKTPSDPAKVVPWLTTPESERPIRFIAVHKIAVPKDLWSQVEGQEDVFQRYSEPSLLRPFDDDIPKNLRLALYRAAPRGAEPIHTMMWTPDNVALFAGAWSPTYHARSRRIQPLIPNKDGAFEPAEPFVKGVLLFVENPFTKMNATMDIQIPKLFERPQSISMSAQGIIFDPSSETAFYLEQSYF